MMNVRNKYSIWNNNLNEKDDNFFVFLKLQAYLLQVPLRNMHELSPLCMLCSSKTFLKACKGDAGNFQFK